MFVGKNKDDDNTPDQDDDGTVGGEGGEGGTTGSGSWVPNYYELLNLDVDEKQLGELVDQSLFEQRISIKAKGYEVTALSKMQKLRNQLNDPRQENTVGGGLNLEEHPELADMGGDVDPNNIVLPESEAAERASNDPQLQLKLKQRMAAKFGMSQNISIQSMKEEYKKKMELRSRPAPDPEPTPQPRYRPTNSPKNRPI